jgi:hypothetical protein
MVFKIRGQSEEKYKFNFAFSPQENTKSSVFEGRAPRSVENTSFQGFVKI